MSDQMRRFKHFKSSKPEGVKDYSTFFQDVPSAA